MAKEIDKFSGMKDMFEQAQDDKIASLVAAREKVESEIRALEYGIDNEYDNGQGDIEDRNELNALNNELRSLDMQIKELQQNQK